MATQHKSPGVGVVPEQYGGVVMWLRKAGEIAEWWRDERFVRVVEERTKFQQAGGSGVGGKRTREGAGWI